MSSLSSSSGSLCYFALDLTEPGFVGYEALYSRIMPSQLFEVQACSDGKD